MSKFDPKIHNLQTHEVSDIVIVSDILSGNNNQPSSFEPYNFTNEVITKFHFPRSTFPQDERGNFKLYEIFSTRLNLEEFLHQYDDSLLINLIPKEYKGEMYYTVQLYDGDVEKSISVELKNEIENFLATLDHNYCPIISGVRSLLYQETILPAFWLNTILPFFITKKHPFKYERGVFKVNFGEYEFYGDIRSRLLTESLNILKKMYELGTIVLNDENFINVWELKPLENIDIIDYGQDIPEISLNHQLKIHKITNYSVFFAPIPTQWLTEMYMENSDTISLKLEPDISSRYAVSRKLLKYKFSFVFYDLEVRIRVNNMKQALEVTEHVQKALATRTLHRSMNSKVGGGENSEYLYKVKYESGGYRDLISGEIKIEKSAVIPN